MGPMTHRQFLAWTDWLDSQWNQPSRSDYYLLKIATFVAKAEQEKIVFLRPNTAKKKPMTLEEATRASHLRWHNALTAASGMTVKNREKALA